ncbi:hypothetical protein [Embleya sp. NBC_00896]|uniref:hypothetical protein n=1 Tax=Embleya sp. NBC_00896 TaxID=2975961 RepID=UPI003867A3C0|nr:hypothetical protein OG928_41075 [Embleya sp. NBC_00896]
MAPDSMGSAGPAAVLIHPQVQEVRSGAPTAPWVSHQSMAAPLAPCDRARVEAGATVKAPC